jgi:hypothetical protein
MVGLKPATNWASRKRARRRRFLAEWMNTGEPALSAGGGSYRRNASGSRRRDQFVRK